MEIPGSIVMIWPGAATQRVMPREGSEGGRFFNSVISSKEEITGRWLGSLCLYSNLPPRTIWISRREPGHMSYMPKGSYTEHAHPHPPPTIAIPLTLYV